MLARRILGALQRLAPDRPGGMRVLCYHLVGAGTDSVVDLPIDQFERQLLAVRDGASPVGLREGLAALRAGDRRSLVAVTVDDAYRNFLEQAWPVLERLAIPVTLFVPTGFVEGTSPPPLSGVALPPCEWAALRDLAASGLVTIGSHTCTHPDLRRLSGEGVDAELRDSRARLEDRLGVEVATFCYPRALWNAGVERRVGAVYDLAVIGGGAANGPEVSPLRVQRTSVRRLPVLDVELWMRRGPWLEEAVADRVRRWRR